MVKKKNILQIQKSRINFTMKVKENKSKVKLKKNKITFRRNNKLLKQKTNKFDT